MMTYNEKATALFGPLGQKAGEQLVAENRDLFLSIDEGQAFSAIASYARLHMEELRFTNTQDSVSAIYRQLLGSLLHTGKVVPSFGLSKRGKEQLDALTAPFRPAPVDVKIVEYQEFNQNADAVDYQLRLSADEGFRRWANATR